MFKKLTFTYYVFFVVLLDIINYLPEHYSNLIIVNKLIDSLKNDRRYKIFDVKHQISVFRIVTLSSYLC